MGRIILSDLHLDSDPLTEYRWGVFNKIVRICQSYMHIEYIDILGDLTEKKDKHDASLVNRISYELQNLYYDTKAKVRILMGNHDYINESEPFFEFLNQMENVYFVSSPMRIGDTYFIPSTKNLLIPDLGDSKYLYLHQPFKGSVAQGGFVLQDGIDPQILKDVRCEVFSGDIHTPQKLGKITYVGAPYHIYFGDTYTGRLVVINSTGINFEELDFPKRHNFVIRNLEDLDNLVFAAYDQVKFRVELEKDKFHLWDTWKGIIKDFCTDKELNLVSTELKPVNGNIQSVVLEKNNSTKDIIDRFAVNEKLTDDFVEIAYEVVNETEKIKNKRV